ncbi:S-layer homology domain-containing protein [Sporosarcina luteola]|uniref:S-layer homology domain-containing protein n=1 Tax=Sporosarcina luteola TaxID=582850 RepID=UPI00203AFBAA|nr:S-layer homology domain-containing protein [Sporosarcina luteola]MCM3636563.1 S-layer homology domain-containing protein [Sporosarcina luteola]
MKKYSRSYQKLFKAVLASSVLGGAIVVAPPTFVQANESGPTLFTDLNPKAYYFTPVVSLSARGIINGYADGTFRPNDSVTRGQAAKIFALALGLDTVNVKNPGFIDVKESDAFYGPIAALVNAGVISGYQDKTFRPNDNLKRSQMAKIITLGFGLERENLSDNRFVDVKTGDSYAGYVQALISNNITTGITPTTFGPNVLVTRGQIASFIFRSELAVSQNGISSQIVDITENTIELKDGTYSIHTEMKSILNPSNLPALKGAKITVNVKDDLIERISSLEITANGTSSNHLVLNGNNAALKGNLIINGDYVTTKNLVIEGKLEIGNAVNNSFQSEAIKVKGKTIVSDNSSSKDKMAAGTNRVYKVASANTFNVSADSKSATTKPTIIFSNSAMGTIEVSKSDVTIESKGTTSVQSFILSSNVHLKADNGVIIPSVILSEGATSVTIDAPVTSLTINTKSALKIEGTGKIGEVTIGSNSSKISFGANTKIGNLILPKGTEAKDVIQDYDKVKANIENIGGETNPEAKPATPAPPVTGGIGGGGNSGGNTGGGTDGSVQQPVAPKLVTLAQDSLGIAGDKKITGLTSDKKYAVIVNGELFGVQENGTLGLKNSSAEVLKSTEITGLDNTRTYKVIEVTGGIIAQDFGFVSGSMYSAGAGLTDGKTISDIATLTVEWFDFAGKSLGRGTLTDKLAKEFPEHTQLSIPLDPDFDYAEDNYWTVDGIIPGEPTRVTFFVKYKNGVEATVDNTRVATTGGIVAQDFGFVSGTMYSAGAGLTEGKTVSDIDTLAVEWFDQNSKPLGKGEMTDKFVKEYPNATQVSMPLDWTFEYNEDGFWDVEGIKLGEPTKVTFTVKYKNGVVAKVDNTRDESGEIIDSSDKLLAAIEAAGENDEVYVAEGIYKLSQQLTINKPITIVGAGESTIIQVTENLGEVNGSKHALSIYSKGVKINNLTIDSNSNAYGVHAYGDASANLENVTIINSKGAGLTVNGSTVIATDLNASGNKWGAVNVDPGSGVKTLSKFVLTGGTLADATQIWSDGRNVDGDAMINVEALGYDKYNVAGTNGVIWTNRELTNIITINGDPNTVYTSIQAAIDAAKADDTINVPAGTYGLSEQLTIDKSISIVGAGESTIIQVTENLGEVNGSKHALSIYSKGVKINNLTIDSNSNAYGVHAYGDASANLENVTIINSKGAGLTVNGSTVIATNLTTRVNQWGAVNVDPGKNVSTESNFELKSGNLAEDFQIWSDGENVTQTAIVNVIAPVDYKKYDVGGLSIWSNKPLNDVMDQEVLAKFSNIDVTSFDYRLAIETFSELLNLDDTTISNLSNLTKNQGRDLAVNIAIWGFQPEGGYETIENLKYNLEFAINTEYHKQLFIVAMNNAGTDQEAIKAALKDTLTAVANDRLELIQYVSNFGDEFNEDIETLVTSDFSLYTKKMLDDLENEEQLAKLSIKIVEYISKEGNAIGGSGDKAIEAIKYAYSNAE